MPCLILILFAAFPRIALVLLFFFSNYLQRAYHGLLLPLLGFIFLPLTTLVYAWIVNSGLPIAGINLVILIIAVIVDLGGWAAANTIAAGAGPIDPLRARPYSVHHPEITQDWLDYNLPARATCIYRGSFIDLDRASPKIGYGGRIMIKKVKGGYKVLSENGKKNLGGPYKTKAAAEKRLRQVEFFKHRKG